MSDETAGKNHAGLTYSGNGAALFWLAFRTGMLTLITLGIYRFWAKTRVRRYIWSSASLNQSRFEYTGTGLEKFLGFLMAVVFLAVYLGVIQIALTYFGLALFSEPSTSGQSFAQIASFGISGFAVVPFVYFAIYRARRYKLARTRWRGIRFGMEKAAWGYVARAIPLTLLSLVTLGLMLPLQTFRLERYMTNRMWFGDAQFDQQGKWTDLYGALRHAAIGAAITALGLGLAIYGSVSENPIGLFSILLLPLGAVWLAIGTIYYRVHSFAYLTRNKMLDGRVAFHSAPRTKTVISAYLLGSLVIAAVASVALGVMAAAMALVMAGMTSMMNDESAMALYILPALFFGLTYLLVFVGAEAAKLALITQPILKHYVETLTVINLSGLDAVHQRQADAGADAEGFADALDIGGGI